MPRVSAEQVKAIIETDVSPLGPFIDAATSLVDEHLDGEGIGEALLTEIERWLAAHFVAVRDPRLQNERIGQASASYEGSANALASGLNSTRYGQQAVALDPTGTLADMGKRTATLKAL